MIWFVLFHLVRLVIDRIELGSQSDAEKDFEILLLRRELAMMQRHHQGTVRPDRADKLFLTALVMQLKKRAGYKVKQLGELLSIVQPETVLRWHRELVRRKWTQKAQSRGGRPATDAEVEALVIRLAQENDWGYGKISGELRKLGHRLSEQTIAKILKRHGLPPLPERRPSLSWQHLLKHYKGQMLACDFFTVETLFLKTIYVLFFIEIGSRRVHFADCTAEPSQRWLTQQARQLMWELDEQDTAMRFLIHDRDTKFSRSFDSVFESEKIDVILTPYQAPNANAFAERWVRTAREECLDKVIILNQKHLYQVMRDLVNYYNTARPHQGIDQQIPVPQRATNSSGRICCRDVLGGIIHDYYREAA